MGHIWVNVKWECESLSHVRLCNPMDRTARQAPLSLGFQARILEWVAIPFSRGSSWPSDRTQVSHIGGRLFTIWATQEALQLSTVFQDSWEQPKSSLAHLFSCSSSSDIDYGPSVTRLGSQRQSVSSPHQRGGNPQPRWPSNLEGAKQTTIGSFGDPTPNQDKALKKDIQKKEKKHII